ncbi:Hypoxanthine/guanine phosphoribosyltransferase [Sulfuracidifex tepidarius]|uniref:Hypoxanthine/guanine phosphoribosyltransferase n=1 Tax=Sulfuracidifex tepidarius TaxID=1294262 RepID=A0A510DX06_9CREN|nr:phosphoribosyltransferase family protein [Sulfuracidifex tepidarius]BBG24498.1 Hypoxanthine/guanine phosphoribosyltransferase [Sulfuracidifex tepidarius]
MFSQNKEDNLRRRLISIELLQELKTIYTYKELSEIFNVQESLLCRYVNGNRIPSEKQAAEIITKIKEKLTMSQILRNQIKVFDDGFIDVSNLLFFPTLLKLHLSLTLGVKINDNINKIVGIASNGLPFATIVASIYDIPLIIAKKHKDSTFLRYLEENVKESNSVVSSIYLREDLIKKNDKVVLVDDVLRSGKTLTALYNLASRAGAKILGAIIIASGHKLPPELENKFQIITLFRI